MLKSVLSSFSHVQLVATRQTIACQAPLSMGFSRQEYWSGLPCLHPGDLPNPGIEPVSLMSPALAGGFFPWELSSRQKRVGTWQGPVGGAGHEAWGRKDRFACRFDPWVRKIRSSGGGNENLLQYSCLKNPMDRGAWQAIVQRVTKSQTRLSD